MGSNEIVIRRATPRDRAFVLATAERLAEFEPPPHQTRERIVAAEVGKLAAYFGRLPTARRRLTRALGREGTALLIAEAAGEPQGFVLVCRTRDYFSDRDQAYVDIVAVGKAAAGKGAGSALLRAAEDWGRAQGHHEIALNVFAANRVARRAYERLGYFIETTRYVKPLQPEGLDRPEAAGRVAEALAQPRGGAAAAAPSHDGPPQTEWFDDDRFWRELYDCIFTPQRFADAPSEVDRLLALVRPQGRAVLDLACGPGRCAVELARRGYSVTGVDRTTFLLDKARERARDAGVEVEWVQADMRDFQRPCRFDLALSLFTSFGYFERPDDDLRVLRRLHESLAPGGKVVLDVVGKETFARMYRPETSERLADGTLLVKRHSVHGDWTRLHEEWVVERGGCRTSYRYRHTLYSGRELRALLEQAGFEDVRLFGGYDGEAYDADAVCLVAVGRRLETHG